MKNSWFQRKTNREVTFLDTTKLIDGNCFLFSWRTIPFWMKCEIKMQLVLQRRWSPTIFNDQIKTCAAYFRQKLEEISYPLTEKNKQQQQQKTTRKSKKRQALISNLSGYFGISFIKVKCILNVLQKMFELCFGMVLPLSS